MLFCINALLIWNREREPSDWVSDKLNLGNAFQLHIAENKLGNIEEAINIYRDALGEFNIFDSALARDALGKDIRGFRFWNSLARTKLQVGQWQGEESKNAALVEDFDIQKEVLDIT